MCCILCWFKPKCVKWTLCLASVLILGCAILSIYFGTVIKDNTIISILGSVSKYTISTYLFYTWVIIGGLLIFLMLWIMCTVCKRLCCCHWLLAITITLSSAFFLVIGIGMIYGSVYASNVLDDIWGSGDSSTLGQAFNKLYSSADSIYCVSTSSGCTCQTLVAITSTTRSSSTASYITSRTTGTGIVTKVQSCTTYLKNAYANYGISFDDIDAISTYLDYFGEIESKYTCSGMCTMLPVYYFSNSNAGVPTDKCKDSIKNKLIKGEFQMYGIGFTCIGGILLIIWFIQYGLCCRKKEAADQQFKRF